MESMRTRDGGFANGPSMQLVAIDGEVARRWQVSTSTRLRDKMCVRCWPQQWATVSADTLVVAQKRRTGTKSRSAWTLATRNGRFRRHVDGLTSCSPSITLEVCLLRNEIVGNQALWPTAPRARQRAADRQHPPRLPTPPENERAVQPTAGPSRTHKFHAGLQRGLQRLGTECCPGAERNYSLGKVFPTNPPH